MNNLATLPEEIQRKIFHSLSNVKKEHFYINKNYA